MATPLVILCLLAFTTQVSLNRVDVGQLTDAPERYNGETVEVRGALHADDEFTYLCSERVPLRDTRGCQPLILSVLEAMPLAEQKMLTKAIRERRRVFWVTVRGRFEATVTHQWGSQKSYGFRLLADRVTRVEPAGRR